MYQYAVRFIVWFVWGGRLVGGKSKSVHNRNSWKQRYRESYGEQDITKWLLNVCVGGGFMCVCVCAWQIIRKHTRTELVTKTNRSRCVQQETDRYWGAVGNPVNFAYLSDSQVSINWIELESVNRKYVTFQSQTKNKTTILEEKKTKNELWLSVYFPLGCSIWMILPQENVCLVNNKLWLFRPQLKFRGAIVISLLHAHWRIYLTI